MPIESKVENRSSASDEPLIRALLARYKCDYPRPQLRREHWISLNGSWDFAGDVYDLAVLLPVLLWQKRGAGVRSST